jgi:ankyrin repeat protein
VAPSPNPLPPRASLEWLRKTAKDRLKTLRVSRPDARLADAQLAIARDHGFSSWRALKAHVDRAAAAPAADAEAAAGRDRARQAFLRLVAQAPVEAVRAAIDADPAAVHATGPHPFWGGRPQPIHVAIEQDRGETFDLLLARGADPNGVNDGYDGWSPLMVTARGGRTRMRDALIAAGARVGVVEALMFADDAGLEALLAGGPSALPGRVPNDGSLLMFARTVPALERLLALGVPADCRDRWGTSPIEAFSRLGAAGAPLVAALAARGVAVAPDVHARLGDLAGLEAAFARDAAAVRADAVVIAGVDARQHEIVAWLLAHGASANARAADRSRQTALHGAAWNGDRRMVDLLIAGGADLQARDAEHDATPRGWAETSIEITGNADAAAVAAHLQSLGG